MYGDFALFREIAVLLIVVPPGGASPSPASVSKVFYNHGFLQPRLSVLRYAALCPIFYKFWGFGALTFSAAETGTGKKPVL